MVDIFTGVYATSASSPRSAAATGPGRAATSTWRSSTAPSRPRQTGDELSRSGKAPTRLGNAHPNIVPYQVFEVADGHVIVAVGNDGQYVRFCSVIGAEHLAGPADYATNGGRVRKPRALVPLLAPS